ncbi:malate:quinone oxidoreductase [Rouxiella sp. S1S-2]|uniref:malate:quinone oxidoreductase n=1 Tax=Rouxiella sp. S1S-2 TaxID=2653856 RepID=UPI00126537C2|nr:malate:quinone oxidoreductase [Rouxiella sp. S1S-2]KAB7894827.1 malate:quinone oxidoreductase [Rouxiella sp. S1S-2]
MKNRLSSALGIGLMALSKHATAAENKIVDVVLIGGGIMSATLGTYLQELEPDWSINMYERLDSVADESSNGWNNAGTGHSALAEMNYTPQKADGSVDISKAVEINEAFQISRQFWSYQVEKKVLGEPRSFITSVPHMSFVWGEKNVEFLRKRHAALQNSTLFRGMEFSEDRTQIEKWIPLVLEGRKPGEKVAATRIDSGTDVNFGAITHQLVESLRKKPNFSLNLGHEVKNIKRNADQTWTVTFAKTKGGRETSVTTRFIFIGAGGASLTLLQKSGIPEASRYGGFPVGGEFLVTDNPDIVKRHQAKVYGKASVGAPPMSVPHLDTRVLDGKKVLLFGPFATFSSKFLKNGSLWDLFGTVNLHNIFPMVRVGLDNFDLVKYLINQVMLSEDQRLSALKEYFPDAQKQDWRLVVAGQRVQIIEKEGKQGGVLRLGTEVVTSQDGSIAALLGASPGASTAAPIMLQLMERVFKDKIASPEWQSKLKEMIPSYGQEMNGNVELSEREMNRTSRILQLEDAHADAAPVKPAAVVQPVVQVMEEEALQEELTS